MYNEIRRKELIDILISPSRGNISEVLEDVHPEDLLDAIRQYEGDRSLLFEKLPEDMLASIIDQAHDDEKAELLELFPDPIKAKVIREMSSDELVDLLGTVTPEEADELLVRIDDDEAGIIKQLLSYDPHTAGGIMATEFIAIKENMTIGETLKYLQDEAPEAETAYYVYVLDEIGKLKGVVSLRDIVISNFDVIVSQIVNENVIRVTVDMDQEEVGHIFEKYGFLTIPVVDEMEKMIGIITVDDIIKIVRDEDTEDIYRLAGISEGEKIQGAIADSVKRRLPWLFVNLLTALLASLTVSLFEGTIQKIVALASFMPIVAGMGGNTGTQTLTIIVRSIALGELTYENAKRVLFKEIGVGVVTGVSIGLAAAFLGFIIEASVVFGVVLGTAMLLNMIAATFAGYLVPMILKKIGVDPALASSVFVTTVTDVMGFTFFLGLATIFSKYF
ncbi:magnesium transporter [Acetivibrio cellulolyticus]|uniref:magnesium transporter n=1 Tax=Acetivibrio cellulolyticus TaxID=35830 RepID=UPI0001E2BDD6|nr:magnesium transporter [Acetivibrio cellulolyticus]